MPYEGEAVAMHRWSMVGELKLISPPLTATAVLAESAVHALPEALRLALDVAALGVLLAGFLVLGKLRAQAAAAEGSAEAWKEERDALAIKVARIEEEKTELRVQISKLESRPTLESLEQQIAILTKMVSQTSEAIEGLKGGSA